MLKPYKLLIALHYTRAYYFLFKGEVFMKMLFALVVLTFLSLPSPVSACQPPPVGYYDWKGFSAISESSEIRQILSNRPIDRIKRIAYGKFVITSGKCRLRVKVDAKQTNPELPCGGPHTFTVTPMSELICR
jgi:hypothetical protein